MKLFKSTVFYSEEQRTKNDDFIFEFNIKLCNTGEVLWFVLFFFFSFVFIFKA